MVMRGRGPNLNEVGDGRIGGGVVCDVPVCPILIVDLPAFASSIPSAYRIGGPQILDHMLRSFLLDGINAPLF